MGEWCTLMADRRLNTWTFPALESWREWLIDGLGINDCKALEGPRVPHDGTILEGREVPGHLHLCPVCVWSLDKPGWGGIAAFDAEELPSTQTYHL